MQFSFCEFSLDTERFALARDGELIHAEPQVIELLVFLIENRGRLVSRDELNKSVWGGRIVTESALSSRIKLARQALGDDGRTQQHIRTIHKKGFSFVTDVEVTPSIHFGDSKPAKNLPIHNSNDCLNSKSTPSIAVMTFINLSNDPAQAYISDGISEDIITTLSKISKLVVLAFPTSVDQAGTAVDSLEVARKLGVRYLLEGSVRSEGSRLRISARLIETETAQHVWAQRYDREFRHIFELQDDITKEVVSGLQVELTEGDQALLASRGTNSIEAWQLTFEGQGSVLEHRQESVRRGLEQLVKAVALDKNYVLAWTSLATAHWKESISRGWSISREQSLEKAIEASDQALELDPQNASTLAARSLIFVSYRKFEKALKLAEKALHYANSEANTIALSAITLRACCRPEMAIQHARKAMRLCPVYPSWYPYGIGVCHWMLGQFEDAITAVDEAISIDPGFSLSYFVLAMTYAETDRPQQAEEAVAKLLRIDPHFSTQAYSEGLPFSDEAMESRRKEMLRRAGMPE